MSVLAHAGWSQISNTFTLYIVALTEISHFPKNTGRKKKKKALAHRVVFSKSFHYEEMQKQTPSKVFKDYIFQLIWCRRIKDVWFLKFFSAVQSHK